MKAAVLCAALVLTGAVACRDEPWSAKAVGTHWSPAQLLGCYEILDAKHRRADDAWYNAMAVVRLTDIPVRESDGTVRQRAWHLRPLSDAGSGHWRADPQGTLEHENGFVPEWSLNASGDSAAFGFSDGFSGAAIEFAAEDADGDALRGHVTEHWDFGPPFSNTRGPAYAIRRPCP
jgi:hypothetical protein